MKKNRKFVCKKCGEVFGVGVLCVTCEHPVYEEVTSLMSTETDDITSDGG